MKTSPKSVKVDLFAESKKRKKSSPRRIPNSPTNALDFSFSRQKSSQCENFIKRNSKDCVSKNLFGRSPQHRKDTPLNYKENKQKSRSKSRPEVRDSLYPNKRGQNRETVLFKKSLEKLKNTFFSGLRNNRDRTVKTLKEIGKYAKYRSDKVKQRNGKQESPPRKKNIPVQFVGFDPNSNQSKYKTLQKNQNIKIVESQILSDSRGGQSSNKEMTDKGTYYNFQEEIKQTLKEKEEALRSDFVYPQQEDFGKQRRTKNSFYQEKTTPQSQFESINQIQIDVVCQIFQMCQKSNQNDRITVNHLIQLLKEFERLYFIRVIQQSEAGSSRSRLKIFESQFNELLREFQSFLKVIFYRREACDIYDCLYYLKESQKLDRVCSLFMGLKNMLQL